MPFWRGETLLQRLPGFIDPFDATAIDCASYTLHMGKEAYISPDGSIRSPNRKTKEILRKGEGFTIPPGQFAFLLTEETVVVPVDAIAFISIKARVKFSGLINISGFHVDPGYRGKLLYSVLNAGPKPLHLEQGQPLFLIWYADLDGPTTETKAVYGFRHIDSTLINGISGEILSLQSLSNKQRSLEETVKRAQILFRVIISLFSLAAVLVVGLFGETIKDLVSRTLELATGN